MIHLRGWVKFPTGGNEAFASKPASLLRAGFGVIPKPTVKSGWEKVKVGQYSNSLHLNTYLCMP